MMKLEDLIKKYSQEKRQKKSNISPLTNDEKQAIDHYLQALKPGEIALVSPITRAIAENRYGKKFSTEQRASVANLVREYLKSLENFEYIPRPSNTGYQPAKVKRLK